MQFLPAALMTTLFPIFVAARDDDPERVRRLFRTAVDYLLLTSLPALAIALAGAEPIVRLLFGADFADAAPALPVLMATLVVVSIGYLTGLPHRDLPAAAPVHRDRRGGARAQRGGEPRARAGPTGSWRRPG